jgi:CheY-like chemotaxis protein
MDLARERSYKAMSTAFGAAAIALARERQPDAITLDICLPDIDGWHVLDRLKHDLATATYSRVRHHDGENTATRLAARRHRCARRSRAHARLPERRVRRVRRAGLS